MRSPVNTSRTEFTLVNNAQQSNVTFVLNDASKTIGPSNSISGFTTWWSTSSTVKIKVGATTYTIGKRKGYEFYKSGSTIKLRVLSM